MVPRKYPHLFSPIKIGPLTLKNRIVSAPTSLAGLSAEGHLTRDNIAYYKLKARGGAVVTVGDCVKPKNVLQAVRTGYDAAMAV